MSFDTIDQAPLNVELAARRYPTSSAARTARAFACDGNVGTLSDAQFAALQAQVHENGMAVIPGGAAGLQPAELHAFGLRWGPIGMHLASDDGRGENGAGHEGLPGMLTLSDGADQASGERAPGASNFGPTWHTDFAVCVRPAYVTILACKVAPD
eukprot:COSAG04_NODE_11465_length_707_cov_1.953947_1_plen_154_part_10